MGIASNCLAPRIGKSWGLFHGRSGLRWGLAPHRLPMATSNSVKAAKGQLDLQAGVTVASLPATSAYTGFPIRVVTDATSPTVGSAPTGGGSAKALVWNNGTAWRVFAV